MLMNNTSEEYIRNSLKKTLSLVNELLSSKVFIQRVLEATNIITNALSNDNCVYLAGNGGSAAHAQHFAAELISRFNFDRNPLPSIALTTDSSIITAVSNDYGFEKFFWPVVVRINYADGCRCSLRAHGNCSPGKCSKLH